MHDAEKHAKILFLKEGTFVDEKHPDRELGEIDVAVEHLTLAQVEQAIAHFEQQAIRDNLELQPNVPSANQ